MFKNKYITLKLVLLAQTLSLVIYTYLAQMNEGWGLVGQVSKNLIAMGWNGQFNLDFACYLLLSAWWILWRNDFKPISFAIAILAGLIGIMFFAPYLVYLLAAEKGNLKRVLVGNR
jgi:hypothetical protein